MAKVTVEIGAKTAGLKAGLQSSQNDVRNWRKGVSSQINGMKADMSSAGAKGGLAGFIGANKGVIGITALVAGVKSLADEVDELQDAADATGVSLNSLSKLGIIFGQGGVKATELRKVLVNISTAAGEVASGSTDAAKKFAELGISAEFVKENVGETEKVLEAVTKAMANQGSVQEAMAKGLPLLGSKHSRFASVAMQMGKDYKGAMADVKGALTDEDAKKVAENMDKIEVAIKGAKNEMANWGGTAIGWIEEAAKAWGQVSVGGDRPQGNPMAQSEGELQAIEAKKKADAESLKIQQEKEASVKRQIEADAKASDDKKKRDEEIVSLQAGQDQLYQDQIDNAVELLSLEEKQNYWLMKRQQATDEMAQAQGDDLKYNQAQLKVMQAQAQIDEAKKKRIDKQTAENLKSPEERAEGRRNERKEERAARRAKRLIDAQDRDDADRLVRGVKPDEGARAGMMASADKPGLTMGDKILGDIKTHSEKTALAIQAIAAKLEMK